MTNKVRFSVTIPATLKTELEQSIPAGKRAQFAVEALEAALREKARKELRTALHNIQPVAPKTGSVEVVRQIRQESSDKLASQK